MKGYELNKMCYSFNKAEARQAFLDDEEAYLDTFGLTDQQKSAVRNRNVLEMIECGGNIYYLAKLAGIFGLSVQDGAVVIYNEFDITSCQEMAVDHGFTVPMQLLWPERGHNMPTVVPIVANTLQHPIPMMKRCLDFGRSLGRSIASYGEDLKVVVLGTGGLSHQLDGERAGFFNREFDEMSMAKLVTDPEALTSIPSHELIAQAGTQGSELIMWMMMRGALSADVTLLHQNYHIPISNTRAGTMLLACQN